MSDKKILVVGELNVDLILNEIRGFPQVGTEIVADKMNFTLGSSSAIMASNISVLGTQTYFCGMIGDDDCGKFVLRQLKLKKVNTDFITKSEKHNTGITVVMNYCQDRANVTHCGAMENLNFTKIPWNKIQEFDHFHISSYFLQKGIKADITRIFKKAKEAGLTTSLDLQFDPSEKWDFPYKSCLPFVDVFFPNQAEILALTRQRNIEDAVKKIKPFSNNVALKLGKNGSRLWNNETDIIAAPFILKKFKDAIGAGDSFNAGFLWKYIEGATLKECLESGNLMGALNTTCIGGTTAFSSKYSVKTQIQQFFKKQL